MSVEDTNPSDRYLYDWRGWLVYASFFVGPIDVSAIQDPKHPTGRIEDGEIDVRVDIAEPGETTSFWVDYDMFAEQSVAIGPEATELVS